MPRMPRRRFASRTLMLALANLLAGCVVAPYGTYYRPASTDPGATFSRAWCGGMAGPTTNIELPLGDGLLLSARAVRDYPERDRAQLPLRLVLAVPAQTAVRFTADRLSIVETGSGRTIDAPLTVRAIGRATLAPTATVAPRKLRPAGDAVLAVDPRAPHGQAFLRANGPAGFAPEAFAVFGPRVEFDAASVPFAAVLLRWPAGIRSPSEYRSDAEQALLVARAEACRRETPQRACDNVIEFGLSRSFAVDTEALHWQGRWWRSSLRGGETAVAGELSLAVKSAAPWRLADNAIVLREEESGIEHTLRFDRLEVVFRDGIALDAPLHVDRAVGAGATEVHIEALLPADLPEFEVRPPPLQVASTLREIAPIRFERRRFDSGVEPLNC